jgi:hypothetical protein
MEEVAIMQGSWEVKVLNPPVGVGLRRHPIDSQTKMFKTIYPTDTLLQCDCKVVGHNGVAFYRVRNTMGWIFDQRGDSDLLQELSADEENTTLDDNDNNKQGEGWTPDFVRGIAATVDGLEENIAWEGSKVLTFRLLQDMQEPETNNAGSTTVVSTPAQDATTTWLLQALSDTNGSTEVPLTHTNTETKTPTIAATSSAPPSPSSSSPVALCFHIFYESRTVGIYDEILQRQVCERDCSTKDLVRLFNSSVTELSDMLRKTSTKPSFTDSVLAAAAAGPPAPVFQKRKKKIKPNLHQRRFEMGSFDTRSFETPSSPSDENGVLDDLDLGEEKKQDYDEILEQVERVSDAGALHDQVESKEATGGGFTNDLQEVELRTQLVRCEEALLNVRQQQVDILKSLKEFDDKRARVALQAKEIAEERRMEDEQEDEAKRLMGSSHHHGEHNKTPIGGGGSGAGGVEAGVRNSTGSGASRKVYRCGECREGFSCSEVRDEHCRDVHGIYCEHCNRAFKNFQRLEQHRENADHW